MKSKSIINIIAIIASTQFVVLAQNNDSKIHLFDDFTIASGIQFSQNYSLTSKQNFTAYFSRNNGFRTKYLNFGISRQEYFTPSTLDGFDFNQRILSNGFYAGFTYPISSKFEIGASYQRNQLKFVHPYTQFNNSGALFDLSGMFDFSNYRTYYDFGNELILNSSYQIEDYFRIYASAKYGFNAETYGNYYVGYALGIVATLPQMNKSYSNIDSLSFKNNRKLYGFIGTTRILKDYRNYQHRVYVEQLNNKEKNLTDVVFNYDLYQPVATVCAGVISKGSNLFYVNFGKSETFTKDRFYYANVTTDLFPDESYLYHAKSQYIGLCADLNPFSLFKKTAEYHLFPVLSFFGHYQQRKQQSARDLSAQFIRPLPSIIQMDSKATILYYGTALGIGAKLGRLYGNLKFDIIKGNQADVSVKRKLKVYEKYYPITLVSEETLPDLDIKGSVSMKKQAGGTGIQSKLTQSAFTIGILF